jgi:hypothetical protein
MNKKLKFTIILVTFAALFSVLAFAIPFERNGGFWVAYIAEMVAIVLQYPILNSSIGGSTAKSQFYGIPIACMGVIYLIGQTILSIVLFCAGFIPAFPVWISIVLCAVVLAFALIGVIGADISREKIQHIDLQEKIQKIYD